MIFFSSFLSLFLECFKIFLTLKLFEVKKSFYNFQSFSQAKCLRSNPKVKIISKLSKFPYGQTLFPILEISQSSKPLKMCQSYSTIKVFFKSKEFLKGKNIFFEISKFLKFNMFSKVSKFFKVQKSTNNFLFKFKYFQSLTYLFTHFVSCVWGPFVW